MTGVRICPNHFGQPTILIRTGFHFKAHRARMFSAQAESMPRLETAVQANKALHQKPKVAYAETFPATAPSLYLE
jgi:hypothetical protein